MKHLFRVAVSLFAIGNAAAQNYVLDVTKRVGDACPAMIGGLLADASLVKATKRRPISVVAICSCTIKRLEADEKLSNYLNSPTRDFISESRSEPLQSYLSLLTASSVYGCLLPELEASKSAISLAR